MISGTCPYKGCEGKVWLVSPEVMPAYERHKCEDCKRWIWTKHSRIDPASWTERNFLKEYKVDKKTKQIDLRNLPKPLTDKELITKAMYEKIMQKAIMQHLIYGIPYDKIDIDSLLSLEP